MKINILLSIMLLLLCPPLMGMKRSLNLRLGEEIVRVEEPVYKKIKTLEHLLETGDDNAVVIPANIAEGVKECVAIVSILEKQEEFDDAEATYNYIRSTYQFPLQKSALEKLSVLLNAANFLECSVVHKAVIRLLGNYIFSEDQLQLLVTNPSEFRQTYSLLCAATENACVPSEVEHAIARKGFKQSVPYPRVTTIRQGVCFSLAYKPDGTQLATAADNTIHLRNPETGVCERTLIGHTKLVKVVAWHPKGNQLASSSEDGTVRLWNITTGECQHILVHTENVNTLAWHPEGTTLASGCNDSRIRLWDVQTGVCQHTLVGPRWINKLAWCPDGKQVASSGSDDGRILLWNIETPTPRCTLKGHADWIDALAYRPHTKQLVSGSRDSIRLWDTETVECLRVLRHSDRLRAVAWHPKGSKISLTFVNEGIQTWCPETAVCRRVMNGAGDMFALAYRPDGKQLASGSYSGEVQLMSQYSNKFLKELSLYKSLLTVLAHQARHYNARYALYETDHSELKQAHEALVASDEAEVVQITQTHITPYITWK